MHIYTKYKINDIDMWVEKYNQFILVQTEHRNQTDAAKVASLKRFD